MTTFFLGFIAGALGMLMFVGCMLGRFERRISAMEQTLK
jgi:hypothetical protein